MSFLRIHNVGYYTGPAHQRASSLYTVNVKCVDKTQGINDKILLSFSLSEYVCHYSHDFTMFIFFSTVTLGGEGEPVSPHSWVQKFWAVCRVTNEVAWKSVIRELCIHFFWLPDFCATLYFSRQQYCDCNFSVLEQGNIDCFNSELSELFQHVFGWLLKKQICFPYLAFHVSHGET
jgi:hypothetical protein